MKRMYLLFCVVGVLLGSMCLSPLASAQCGGVAKYISYPWGRGHQGSRFQLAAAAQITEAQEENGPEPIVGLWKTDFEDPADSYSDKGYATWHSDGTEFMNSTRPPSSGAVCQGVWEKVGRSTYRLNHFAMGYGDGVHLTSVYRFKELVTVDRSGNTFSGTFSIEAYDPKTHAPQGTYKGTLTGENRHHDRVPELLTYSAKPGACSPGSPGLSNPGLLTTITFDSLAEVLVCTAIQPAPLH